MNSENNTIRAPEFPGDMEWLNTERSLSLEELRGKIVLLDFWTYCCINCIHVLPDLKKLEEKYAEELVVIGVHSAKFFTEQGTDNIRQAILRYNITHPVVNDKDLRIWNEYNANAWPTLVLINPEGYIAYRRSGENVFDALDGQIQFLLDKFEGEIDRTPMDFVLEQEKIPDTFLKFPGKVTADAENDRLYITDSNNNRIVVTDMAGNLLKTIGSGEKGQSDGSFESAQFNQPQGTVLLENSLYIADTENHLIRRADLESETVETIAGIGRQVYNRRPDDVAKYTGLNSPWDLTIADSTLYIAKAGSHQIWRLDLRSGNITLHAGSGYENIKDGPLTEAQLAQPSGITHGDGKIYFADSEVSGIRSADIAPQGKVRTIIGHGLFEYGDKDGSYRRARLQHPLGITYVDGMLYIADTYNNKIKRIDPDERTSETVAGTGEPGMKDGKAKSATFDEPGGIDYADGKLYIADTNNHLVRVFDLESKTVSTLKISGIREMAGASEFDPESFSGTVRDPVTIDLNSLNQIRFDISLPKGYKLNPLATSQVRLIAGDGSIIKTAELTGLPQSLPLKESMKPKYAELLIYYCRKDNEGLCFIDNSLVEFRNSNDGMSGEITVSYDLMVQS
ncbi:MAG: redoxin domain-containing protein [Candidatus Marinimicrobia bacterium]|nr:redoxin domain-containing protein [Candidatus Neomarinimicrobiota bacterium]MCF7829479.1 redoxin domain-containing protein [Candidatus Neomarinimicrobiota bacterium]MCF7880123.1 redoxin domain-containing protein [Candidatus Neomarinimicrobiota bacterium]